MPPRVKLVFLGLSVVFFALSAVPLYSELTRRSDIWWTPYAMLVPLGESRDRVEIYARGRPLNALIEAGQLRIADAGGSSVLRASDVGLRFNNWDRVRANRVPIVVVGAAGCIAAVLMFFLMLTGRLTYRGEKEPAPRQP